MPSIPINSPLSFLGVLFFIFGGFLLIAGLNIIKIEKVSVTPGKPTWISGVVLAVLGIIFLLLDNPNLLPILSTPSQSSTPTSSRKLLISELNVDLAETPGLDGIILYTAKIEGQLTLISSLADGSNDPNVLTDFDASSAMWSHDGEKIVFQQLVTGTSNIFIVWKDGSNNAQLTDVPTGIQARTASWFPTQELIFFEADIDGKFEIYQVQNPPINNQRDPIKITNTDGGESSSPSISPHGQFMTFSSDADGDWDIYVLELGKEDEWTQLTNSPGSDEFPVWSPDGRQIAFSSDRDGHFEIYVMNADGTQQEKLTSTPEDKWSRVPAWSPDGEKLIYVSNQGGPTSGSFYGDIFLINVNNKVLHQLTSGGNIWTWRVSWAN